MTSECQMTQSPIIPRRKVGRGVSTAPPGFRVHRTARWGHRALPAGDIGDIGDCVIGHWEFTGHWSLVIVSLVTGHWSLVIVSLVIGNSLVIGHSSWSFLRCSTV